MERSKQQHLDLTGKEMAVVSGSHITIQEKIPILINLVDVNTDYITDNCNKFQPEMLALNTTDNDILEKLATDIYNPNAILQHRTLFKAFIIQFKNLEAFNNNVFDEEINYLEHFRLNTRREDDIDPQLINNLISLIKNYKEKLDNKVTEYYSRFIDEFKKHIEAFADFSSAYVETYEKEVTTLAECKGALKIANLQLGTKYQDFSEIFNEMANMTSEASELRSENLNLKNQIDNFNRQKDIQDIAHQRQLSILETQIQKLETGVDTSPTHRVQNQIESTELNDLKYKNNNLEMELKSAEDKYNDQLIEKNNKIDSLNKELMEIFDQNQQLSMINKASTDFINQYKPFIEQWQTLKSDLENKIRNLNRDNVKFKNSYEDLIDKHSELYRIYEENSGKYDEIVKNNQLIFNENTNLRTQIKSSTELIEIHQKLLEDKDAQLNYLQSMTDDKVQQIINQNENIASELKIKNEEIANLNAQLTEKADQLRSIQLEFQKILKNKDDAEYKNNINNAEQERVTDSITDILVELYDLQAQHPSTPTHSTEENRPKIIPYTPFQLKTFLYNSVSYSTFDIGLFNKSLSLYGKSNIMQALRCRRWDGKAKKNSVLLYSDASIAELNDYRLKFMKILE